MAPSCFTEIFQFLRGLPGLRSHMCMKASTQVEPVELVRAGREPAAPGHTLLDISKDVLIDHLLGFLPSDDLSAFAATSKAMAALVDEYWRKKLQEEYNFTSSETARKSGWNLIYHGMHRRRVFVWGTSSDGRLGWGPQASRRLGRTVTLPINPRLRASDERAIVALSAGGCSFHAMNAIGQVYVWGLLDREHDDRHQINWFDESEDTAYFPVRLDFGSRLRYIVCGRFHSLALDASGNIWHFSQWHAPLRLICPFLNGTTAASTVVQVECGWTFSVALTADGACYIWWHKIGAMRDKIANAMSSSMARHPAAARTVNGERVLQCAIADVPLDAVRLPELPNLPGTLVQDDMAKFKLAKIAAGEHFLIGLTNRGHVLKLDVRPLGELQSLGDGLIVAGPEYQWNYLPCFSEYAQLGTDPAFPSGNGNRIEVPGSMHITHISAHFRTFFAYSDTTVLQGDALATSDSRPEIIPELQNRGIIAVVLGDYHFGALTSNGKLLTWGRFFGGPEDYSRPAVIIKDPTEVDFGRGRFVIAATASGWHIGAVVLDPKPGIMPNDFDQYYPPSDGEDD